MQNLEASKEAIREELDNCFLNLCLIANLSIILQEILQEEFDDITSQDKTGLAIVLSRLTKQEKINLDDIRAKYFDF